MSRIDESRPFIPLKIAVLTMSDTRSLAEDKSGATPPEAVQPLFDKHMDGFSTAFHIVSFGKIGSSTIQSRACAGVSGSTFIFCLPGSPGACRDAWDEILKYQLDYRHRPCNFVEIMPRLDEHLKRGKAKTSA